ncbi:hypothetical protein NE237_011004 [Protea cynaroides]|uniref:Uncharacterized protein n=1 Tax=Protea cynaroides TaxID=273540 RepID=A0A9Q0L0S6_9MAGN|nr:hypothetical protein NE237_011004 [Protea cynaroides]
MFCAFLVKLQAAQNYLFPSRFLTSRLMTSSVEVIIHRSEHCLVKGEYRMGDPISLIYHFERNADPDRYGYINIVYDAYTTALKKIPEGKTTKFSVKVLLPDGMQEIELKSDNDVMHMFTAYENERQPIQCFVTCQRAPVRGKNTQPTERAGVQGIHMDAREDEGSLQVQTRSQRCEQGPSSSQICRSDVFINHKEQIRTCKKKRVNIGGGSHTMRMLGPFEGSKYPTGKLVSVIHDRPGFVEPRPDSKPEESRVPVQITSCLQMEAIKIMNTLLVGLNYVTRSLIYDLVFLFEGKIELAKENNRVKKTQKE